MSRYANLLLMCILSTTIATTDYKEEELSARDGRALMNKTLIIGVVVGGIVVAGLVASLLYFFTGSALGAAETPQQNTQETTSPEETLPNNLTPEQLQKGLEFAMRLKKSVAEMLKSQKDEAEKAEIISKTILDTKKWKKDTNYDSILLKRRKKKIDDFLDENHPINKSLAIYKETIEESLAINEETIDLFKNIIKKLEAEQA